MASLTHDEIAKWVQENLVDYCRYGKKPCCELRDGLLVISGKNLSGFRPPRWLEATDALPALAGAGLDVMPLGRSSHPKHDWEIVIENLDKVTLDQLETAKKNLEKKHVAKVTGGLVNHSDNPEALIAAVLQLFAKTGITNEKLQAHLKPNQDRLTDVVKHNLAIRESRQQAAIADATKEADRIAEHTASISPGDLIEAVLKDGCITGEMLRTVTDRIAETPAIGPATAAVEAQRAGNESRRLP